jgi:thiol-disulfide isomerase/thioredoxin
MHRRHLLTFLAVCVAAVLTGCGESSAPAPKPAPGFRLKTLDGRTLQLSDYRGKVVLVDFWGTYCPPCIEAIPGLVKLRNQLHPSGFEVIGVACDLGPEGKRKIVEAVKKLKISYPIVRIDEKAAEAYAVDALPALFVIDRQGNLLDGYVGSPDRDAFEARIRGLVEDGGWRSPAVRGGG